MGQNGIALVGGRRRISERETGGARYNVLVCRPGDRIVGITCNRKRRRRDQTVQRPEIVFPARPNRGVAAGPQEGIVQNRRVRERRRIVGAGRRVVECLICLAAAVRRLIHHFVVAIASVQRLQNVEIVLIDNVTLRVFWRELDVGDKSILRICWVDLAGSGTGDKLILTDARK